MENQLVFTGERVVPWDIEQKSWATVLRDHIARYTFVLPHIANKKVCDLGCGTGYGAFIMSMVAESVAGYDKPEAIGFAKANFKATNLKFYEKDLEAYKPAKTDVLVCFEVMEHLKDAKAFGQKLADSEAIVFWSVPVADAGEFHKHVFTKESAANLVPGSGIWYQSEQGYIVPATQANFSPKYIIGVLSK